MNSLEEFSKSIPVVVSVITFWMVTIEWIVLSVTKRIESHKEGITNVLSGAITYFPIFILNIVITVSAMYFTYQYRVFDLEINWYVGILAFAAYDFMSYLIHWLSHKVRFFWCIHSVHHSAKEMKTSLTFRDSFAKFLLSPHVVIWLPLLGFHPLLIVIVQSFEQLYAVPLHFSEKLFSKSNTNTTWINKIFITPAIHRVHHGKNDIYLDKNYGITFSIWDHIFKTYQKEEADVKPIFGLTKEIDSENLLVTQTDGFKTLWRDIKNAPRLLDKVKYIALPPGWRHEDLNKDKKRDT